MTTRFPEADAAAEAGRLIERLPNLWTGANLEERRKLLLTMLDAVYVDAKDERLIVAVRPRALFKPVFQMATTREAGVLPRGAGGGGQDTLPPRDSPHPPPARRAAAGSFDKLRAGQG